VGSKPPFYYIALCSADAVRFVSENEPPHGYVNHSEKTKASHYPMFHAEGIAMKCTAIRLLSAGLLAGFTYSHSATSTQDLGLEWVRQFGTSLGEHYQSLDADTAGNVYASGSTFGDYVGPNAGSSDAYLVKFNTHGQVLWQRQSGSSSHERCWAIAVDGTGNAYISGETHGNLEGSGFGQWDAFLIKYDASGNLLWTRQTGTPSDDFVRTVAVDRVGNAYISGWKGSNGSDPYLSKYDTNGNEVWTRQLGSAGDQIAASYVAVDGDGNPYVTGTTKDSVAGLNAGGNDALVMKYDSSGNLAWSRQLGSPEGDLSLSTAVDAGGNVFITGYTAGNLGGLNAGRNDAFLAKYDSAGNLAWTRQLGWGLNDNSYSVAVDSSGNVLISGMTEGPLAGAHGGSGDAFLLMYDTDGKLLSQQQLGSTAYDESYAVAVDGRGNAYISGYTGGDLGGAQAGAGDTFLAKFSIPEPSSLTLLGCSALIVCRRRR